jgi:hypothetical protein
VLQRVWYVCFAGYLSAEGMTKLATDILALTAILVWDPSPAFPGEVDDRASKAKCLLYEKAY